MSKSAEAYVADLPPEAQPAAIDDYNTGRKHAALIALQHLKRLHQTAMHYNEDHTALEIEYSLAVFQAILGE